MLEPVLQTWKGLSARDRRMLVVGGTFLAIVAIWMLGFQPAWKGRQQMTKELPVLRGELAQMDQLVAEARIAATSNRPSTETAAQLKARIEQSLTEAGLMSSVAQLEATSELIEVRFNRVAFDKWLYWLDADRRSLIDAGSGRRGQRTHRIRIPAARGIGMAVLQGRWQMKQGGWC